MSPLPDHIEQTFFELIAGTTELADLEKWVYSSEELKSLLTEDQYFELASFDYQKDAARHDLVKLVSSKIIDLGRYEKWKIINLLNEALEKNDRLPELLDEFDILFCRGYEFLCDLGYAYNMGGRHPLFENEGMQWKGMTSAERKLLLDRSYPHLEKDLIRTKNWLENGKIILAGKSGVLGRYQYEDYTIEEDRLQRKKDHEACSHIPESTVKQATSVFGKIKDRIRTLAKTKDHELDR